MTIDYALPAGLDGGKPERRPGDFDRDANGTPWVSHPDGERTKPKRKGDEGHVKRVRYSRPSGFGEQILDSYNLQKWSERMIVAGFAYGLGTSVPLDRLEALAPADNDNQAWRAEADAIVKLAKERAKYMLAPDRGTHAHGLTENADLERDYIAMIDDGVNLGLSPDVQHALVECWQQMLDRHGIEILATELAVVHDGYRCAGTLDRIVRLTRDLTFCLPGGELVTLKAGTVLVLDLKTGKLRHDNGEVSFWDNYPIQVAIYAGSVGYNPDTDERYDLPWQVDQRYAIIAHLDVLGAIDGNPACELILVDLELGRRGADLVRAAKEYEKADTKFSLVGTCNVVDRVDNLGPRDKQLLDEILDETSTPPLTEANKPQTVTYHAAVAEVEAVVAHRDKPTPPTPTPSPTPSPSEGATVDSVADIRTAYDALDDAGRTWVNAKRAEALEAGVDFHLSVKTERRAAIMTGLVALATAGAGDTELDIILEPYAPTVGLLDHTLAREFADACNRYIGQPVESDRVAELFGATVEEGAA